MPAENDIDARGSFAVVERSMSDRLLELNTETSQAITPQLRSKPIGLSRICLLLRSVIHKASHDQQDPEFCIRNYECRKRLYFLAINRCPMVFLHGVYDGITLALLDA